MENKMKFMTFLLLIGLISCVQPRDKNASYADKTTGSSGSNTSSSSGSSSSSNSSNVSVSDNTTTTSASLNVPAEISHCSWSSDGQTGFSDTSNHIGANTICQSSSDKNSVYVQLKTPLPDVRLCLIPTYESNGRSIFLGEARCLFTDSSTTIYKFPLVKNRDYGRYQNFVTNGVMVVKEQTYFFDSPFYREQISYDAYFICSVNLDLYGDASYCDAYKSKGEYFYKKF